MRNKNSLTVQTLVRLPYLEVPDITDYKWVHDSEIQNDGSDTLDEIHQCKEVFAVVDRKTIDL